MKIMLVSLPLLRAYSIKGVVSAFSRPVPFLFAVSAPHEPGRPQLSFAIAAILGNKSAILKCLPDPK
jgi:hypothetical protein